MALALSHGSDSLCSYAVTLCPVTGDSLPTHPLFMKICTQMSTVAPASATVLTSLIPLPSSPLQPDSLLSKGGPENPSTYKFSLIETTSLG